MSTELIVLTVGHAVSAVMLLGLGFFVLLNGFRRMENWLFFCLALATAFFNTCFAVSINLPPSPLSYHLWLLNVFDVFIMTFYIHFMLRAIDRHVALRWYIRFTYAVAFGILIAVLFFPHLFLPEVTAKMYLKSYLNAGPLYSVMLFFFLALPLVAFFELVRAYFRGGFDRIRAEYYIATSILGYGLGTISFYLVYNIPVDPLLGMFVGLYTIPIAYGIVAKQLLDIRLAVKRAFFYAIGIALVSGALAVFLMLNNLLIARVPWIQFWTVPFSAGVVAFVLGRVFWLQSQEADRLKYEFITVATHKLRTPLTRIRWGVVELLEVLHDKENRERVMKIDDANNHLIELTNVLLEASRTEDVYYGYSKEPTHLDVLLAETIEHLKSLVERHGIIFSKDISPNIPPVAGDSRRLASVIEVLLENALTYTPQGGTVAVSLSEKDRNIIFSVRDSGIGISSEDQKLMFTRFFRTDKAKVSDTEGMGLGLAMAKTIVERHRGDIGFTSDGEGKGSTFWFSLPL